MNAIVILLDDLGWNDIEPHNTSACTPNIKRLVQEGCELRSHYSFSTCTPTRAMIQTGIHGYKYGMQTLVAPWVDYGLDVSKKIIPQYLTRHKSFALGKWHLGHNREHWLPTKRGYEYHYGNLTGCIGHYEHAHCNNRPEARLHDFSENGRPIYPKGHSCDLITDKALEIVESNRDFFLYLAYNSPHVPLECPKKWSEIHKEESDENRRLFMGMVSHLDHNIGRLINKLKELGIYDDTLIWLQSDNGGWMLDWAGGSNAPLNGGKCSFFEGGIRTFCVLKHREISASSYDCHSHCTDLLPTVLDFLDYETTNLDGVSLKTHIEIGSAARKDMVICYFNCDFWCFIFEGIKFIRENKASYCFDLNVDPLEKNNIWDEKQEKFAERIRQQINLCETELVKGPNQKIEEIEIARRCNKKYWGQRDRESIMVLGQREEAEEHSSFLSHLGYRHFYQASPNIFKP